MPMGRTVLSFSNNPYVSPLLRFRSPNVSNRPRQHLSISVHDPHNGGGAGSTIRNVVPNAHTSHVERSG